MLALWLPLLTVLSQPSGVPQITPKHSPSETPPEALICISKADRTTFADVQKGRCPEPTTRAPTDAWFSVQLQADAPDSVLYSSEVHALKHGELELSLSGGPPHRVHTFDALATRPYYDGRLSFPITTSANRPASLLLRMCILDRRQLYRTERQVMIMARLGMQQAPGEPLLLARRVYGADANHGALSCAVCNAPDRLLSNFPTATTLNHVAKSLSEAKGSFRSGCWSARSPPPKRHDIAREGPRLTRTYSSPQCQFQLIVEYFSAKECC